MVGNVFDVYVPLFDPVVELFQIIETFHVPCHVVQADLPLLLQRRVISHLNQRDFMGEFRSADMKATRPGVKS